MNGTGVPDGGSPEDRDASARLAAFLERAVTTRGTLIRRLVLVIPALTGAFACSSPEERRTVPPGAGDPTIAAAGPNRTPAAPDSQSRGASRLPAERILPETGSAEERAAAARLAAFLERVVLTSPVPVPDSLLSCNWPTDSVLALATYRVLSAVQRGDTVDAAAEVITVAQEIAHPDVAGRYLAALRVRRDTLHWRMTPHLDYGGWGVCGYSVEGWAFLRRGFDVPDSPVRWTPPGASWARARALVDSIRGQR